MQLLVVTDHQRAVVAKAIYNAKERSITIKETPGLIAARRARTRFRHLVAAEAVQCRWDVLTLKWDNQIYRIVPLKHEHVTEQALVRAYRAIWINAEIYQKVFTATEAQNTLRQLDSGLVLLDQSRAVCGLVGGWPVTQTPAEEFAHLVHVPARSTYLAEWGLVDSSPSSKYRGLGLGSFLMALYLHNLVAEGQTEVILNTAEQGYSTVQNNPARPLYEAHGFEEVRDSSGHPVSTLVTQLRLDGQLGTHKSIYFYATSESIRAALTPGRAQIAGFQFNVSSD